ncbi:hypothetical protein [Desulforegula conservatrix]|uniref:hypothetical protein n=1 Tax=Desulforegula conservatrix TaxID=153026 RepID=UPI0004873437|nr:hypothetical protein [Desulforegula conservatrix]
MKIKLRIFAIIILLISLAEIAFGLYGITIVKKISEFLEFTVVLMRFEYDFDSYNWSMHWLITCTLITVSGFIGAITGFGLLKSKEWARKLWLIQITVILLIYIILYLGDFAKYAFETIDIFDVLIAFILFLLSWYILTRQDLKKILAT